MEGKKKSKNQPRTVRRFKKKTIAKNPWYNKKRGEKDDDDDEELPKRKMSHATKAKAMTMNNNNA